LIDKIINPMRPSQFIAMFTAPIRAYVQDIGLWLLALIICDMGICVQAQEGIVPQISVSRRDESLELKWPSGLIGFRLETVKSLSSNNWVIVESGNTNQITISLEEAQRFYRLRCERFSRLDDLLQRRIILPDSANSEVRSFVDRRIPEVPSVQSIEEWTEIVEQWRRDTLNKVIFEAKE
jgi:hypothetical protein